MLEELENEAYESAKEIIEKAKLKEENILVVGCSTSEVLASDIGTASSFEAAVSMMNGIKRAADEKGVYIAAQCCEHLNRAIIVEQKAVPFTPIVNVLPFPKAGGSFATAAYYAFENPVAVEHIKADAGMDIGDTLIGMHLKEVAVPLRPRHNTIGSARVVAARVRPKFIGGARAHYDEDLM